MINIGFHIVWNWFLTRIPRKHGNKKAYNRVSYPYTQGLKYKTVILAVVDMDV
jgi:hypothetical protein